MLDRKRFQSLSASLIIPSADGESLVMQTLNLCKFW
jgi:hypothetical protein